MRTIDADPLVKALEMFSDILTDCKIGEGVWYALGFVKDAPTIDAVPVVRCKDCISFDKEGICQWHEINRSVDDYCSDGKEEE